jgi:hypothetical protein
MGGGACNQATRGTLGYLVAPVRDVGSRSTAILSTGSGALSDGGGLGMDGLEGGMVGLGAGACGNNLYASDRVVTGPYTIFSLPSLHRDPLRLDGPDNNDECQASPTNTTFPRIGSGHRNNSMRLTGSTRTTQTMTRDSTRVTPATAFEPTTRVPVVTTASPARSATVSWSRIPSAYPALAGDHDGRGANGGRGDLVPFCEGISYGG